MRTLMLCCLLAALGGCAFSTDEGPLNNDPYAGMMREVNEEYRDTWYTYGPTALGNVLGGAAYFPLAAVVAPFEWMGYGATDHAPLAEMVVAKGAYLGGFAVGTPFVALHWLLYKAWARGLDAD